MKSKALPFAVIAVITLLIAWVASPYVTVWQVKRAMDNRDAIALADHIDFQSLRDSVKGHLAPMVAKLSAPKTGDTGLAGALSIGLGAMMTGVINNYVDSFLTPEGLRTVMNQPEANKDNRKMLDDTFKPRAVSRMSYESPNRFSVGMAEAHDQPNSVVFVFTRSGLFEWKLSSLRLPVIEF